MQHLKGKNDEYKQIKERRMKRPVVKFKETKFGKMKKKAPFVNASKTKMDLFQDENDLVEVGEPARDYRVREALIFPDKVKNHTKQWKYQGHKTDVLLAMAGREIDKFDDERVKFFNTPSRTIGSTQVVKKNPDGTIKETQSVKWNATKFRLDEIDHVKPLIDNTHTPRSREKVISLERNYEKKKKWVPNNFSLNEFKQKQKKSFAAR